MKDNFNKKELLLIKRVINKCCDQDIIFENTYKYLIKKIDNIIKNG